MTWLLFAFLTPPPAPRIEGCEEHTYASVDLDPGMPLTPLFKAIRMWERVGHEVVREHGRGVMVVRHSPEFLNLFGYNILGVTSWYGDDCMVYVRDADGIEVLAHEIGHCLCYNHWDDGPRSGLMQSTYNGGAVTMRGLHK